MPARYHSWVTKGWRFVVLDGNDLSLYAYAEGSPRHDESVAYHEALDPPPPTWCGAVGTEQLAWLEAELAQADAQGEAVVVLCHFPVLGVPGRALWNAEEVLAVLDRHPSVVAWLNGHDHAGGHVEREGVHHLTFRGMVDTGENAFALVELDAGRLRVRGFGREPDRDLALRDGAALGAR
jgi:3',5'-cyclic AMP phosphodiesterase CpdA